MCRPHLPVPQSICDRISTQEGHILFFLVSQSDPSDRPSQTPGAGAGSSSESMSISKQTSIRVAGGFGIILVVSRSHLRLHHPRRVQESPLSARPIFGPVF